MEGGGRQSVSFKYTDSIQRPGARAQGLGKMVTNTKVSAQDKAEDGKDLDARDHRDGGGGSNRARPCMISSRDFLTFNFRLLFMQKYDLAQKEPYGGWRKELEGKCHPHILI